MDTNYSDLSPAPTAPLTSPPAAPPGRILLIDDDPLFGAILRRHARRAGTVLVHCSSVRELAALPRIAAFDAILLDYHLGALNGGHVSAFLNLFFGDVPVAMVSSSSEWWFRQQLNYPACIRTYIHKDRPQREIIDIARRLPSLRAERAFECRELPPSVTDYETFAAIPRRRSRLVRAYRSVMAVCGQRILGGLARFTRA